MDIKPSKHHHNLLEKKSILAIDFGTKTTGLAKFVYGQDPFPLIFGKIQITKKTNLIEEISKIVGDESIDIIVVGLPLYVNGKESEATQRVKKFAQDLKNKTQLPTYLQDETLTSFEAEERMKNSPRYNFKVDKNAIDELSALIILEDFISSESLNELL